MFEVKSQSKVPLHRFICLIGFGRHMEVKNQNAKSTESEWDSHGIGKYILVESRHFSYYKTFIIIFLSHGKQLQTSVKEDFSFHSWSFPKEMNILNEVKRSQTQASHLSHRLPSNDCCIR